MNVVAPSPQYETPKLISTSESDILVQLDEEVRELLVEVVRIILIEFVEAAAPLFYAAYMLVLFHLPNAKYYPEMEHLTATDLARTVRNITVYAMLELMSVLYLHLFLWWTLKLSALHMLSMLQFSHQHAGSCQIALDNTPKTEFRS